MGHQEVGWEKDWIKLAQDMDRWRAFEKAVMNILFVRNAGNFFIS
jgi:hypothetical protein